MHGAPDHLDASQSSSKALPETSTSESIVSFFYFHMRSMKLSVSLTALSALSLSWRTLASNESGSLCWKQCWTCSSRLVKSMQPCLKPVFEIFPRAKSLWRRYTCTEYISHMVLPEKRAGMMERVSLQELSCRIPRLWLMPGSTTSKTPRYSWQYFNLVCSFSSPSSWLVYPWRWQIN